MLGATRPAPLTSNACFRPDLLESTTSQVGRFMNACKLCARGLVGFAHLQRGAFGGSRMQFRLLPMLVFAWT